MRILLVTANYRPLVGGIERFVELLAEGLARRGHEPTVLCCRSGRAAREETRHGVRVVRLPASDVLVRRLGVPYPLPRPATLVRTLRERLAQADVAHVQDAIYATSVAALALARRAGVPSLLTQHVAFVPQRSPALDALERAAIATLGRGARLASRVVAYNPAVADWARETWRLGAVDVLPVGVAEPDARGLGREAIRLELGLPRDRFLCLFVGRDVPKKRLDLVLAATDPAYEIVAVSDRPSASAPSGARILPFLAPERFQQLLLAADAFCLPSHAEGVPLALQEALLAGLPCLVAREPGYERALREGEVVYVEPTAAAIRAALKRLAGDEPLRRELAARAREAGRREFGLDRFVEAYEAAYAELRSSRPSADAIFAA